MTLIRFLSVDGRGEYPTGVALASVIQLVGRQPIQQEVAGSTPCQGTYHGFGLSPQ